MRVEDQIPLVRRFMLRLAPEVARASLRELPIPRSPYIVHDEAEQLELLSALARRNAQLTFQLAMHLAGVYARFYDETEETAPTPSPAPLSEPQAAGKTGDLS